MVSRIHMLSRLTWLALRGKVLPVERFPSMSRRVERTAEGRTSAVSLKRSANIWSVSDWGGNM